MLSFNRNLLPSLNRLSPGHASLVALSVLTLIGSFSWSVDHLGYDAQAVARGELWRPMTAWITQLNVRHWLLNQWGLIVLWMLWPAYQSVRSILPYLLVWTLCSGALLYSDYDNYVGLSGLLYGWLVIAAVRTSHYPHWVQGIFLAVLSGKVLMENIQPATADTGWVGAFITAEVAHESHLWGLLSGWGFVLSGWLAQQVRSRLGCRD